MSLPAYRYLGNRDATLHYLCLRFLERLPDICVELSIEFLTFDTYSTNPTGDPS